MDIILTGTFTIIGVILGFIMEKISRSGKLHVFINKTIVDSYPDDILHHIDTNISETKYGEVFGIKVWLAFINLADYDRFIHDIKIKINKKVYHPLCTLSHLEDIDKFQIYLEIPNNSYIFRTKKYEYLQLFIPKEVLKENYNNSAKVKMIYKKRFIKKIYLGKIDVKEEIDKFVAETHKIF